MSMETERATHHLSLSLLGFTEYNDNRNATKTNKKGTFLSGIGPQIAYKASLPAWGFFITYNPMYTWWSSPSPGTHQYEWTHALALNGDLDLTPRTSVNIENRFWLTQDPTVFLTGDFYDNDGLLQEAGEPWDASHWDNRTTVGLVHTFSDRFRANADATYRVLKYLKRPTHRMYNFDESQIMTSLNLWHQVTFHLDGGLRFAYNRYMRDSSAATDTDMDMDTYTVSLMANYKLTGGIDFRGAWGYQIVSYDDPRMGSRSYPMDVDLSLKAALTSRSELVSGYRQMVSQAIHYPYVSQTRYSLYAVYFYRHTEHLTSNWRTEYIYSGYRQANSVDANSSSGSISEIFFRGSLDYRMTKDFTLSGYYSLRNVWVDKADPFAGNAFTRNIVGVRGTYVF